MTMGIDGSNPSGNLGSNPSGLNQQRSCSSVTERIFGKDEVVGLNPTLSSTHGDQHNEC